MTEGRHEPLIDAKTGRHVSRADVRFERGESPMTDRAVSPVLGVILMVAVTVILASAVGVFLIGQTPGEDAPDAGFEFGQATTDDVVVRHTGGEDVDTERLTVLVAGVEVTPTYSQTTLSAGATITIASADVSAGDRIELVYELPDGDTRRLAAWEVPAA